MSRYLTFDPEVYFTEQREAYLQHEFALGVHVLRADRPVPVRAAASAPVRPRTPVHGSDLCRECHRAWRVGPDPRSTAYTGLVASAGFTVLDLAMLFTTWTAVRMVMTGRFGEHRRWMIRSFSLILAGVMLRVWVPIYGQLAAAGILGFSFETAYAAIAWLCWVPNLLLALWFTRHPAEVTNAG